MFPKRCDAARVEHLVVLWRRGVHPRGEQALEHPVLLDRSDLKEAFSTVGLRGGTGGLLRLDVAEPLVRCAEDVRRGADGARVAVDVEVELEKARVKVIEEDLGVEDPCPL